MFTVDHDRYWQSCDAEEADGSSQAGAGASPASAPDTQLWPGQGPQSVSGGSQVYTVPGHTGHWGRGHVKRVWAPLELM